MSVFSTHSVVTHNLTSNRPPLPSELKVGEIAVWIQENRARLFTKTITNEILEINKSIEYLSDLLDVDITNLREGSFLVKQGDKFVASNVLGNITDLTDIEIQAPLEARQYLRYDSLLAAFVNIYPSYNLYELLDLEVLNPNTATAAQSLEQNDKTLYYDHNTRTFKTRLRRNLLGQLDDVEVPLEEFPSNKLLVEDENGIWSPQPLAIINDISPELGGDLDFRGNYSINQTYKINRISVTGAIHNIDYTLGDYWIIQGAAEEVVPTTVLNIESTPELDQALILMLEIRQSTGQLLLGGLQNVEYEDGRPINLSGAGKTDLVTILITNTQVEGIRTVIAAAALNLATAGEGGDLAERYPGLTGGSGGGTGSGTQLFAPPSLYDSYYSYVNLLLNFEDEVATGKSWTEDKSLLNNPTTVTASQLLLASRPFGLSEFAANFSSLASSISINPTTAIELDGDFTLEFFINYPQNDIYRKSTSITHSYFESNDLHIKYIGTSSPTGSSAEETSRVEVKIKSNTYNFSNALRLFHNQNNRFVHFALIRNGINILLYVDGILFQPDSVATNSPVSTLILDAINISLEGNLNSVRLTKDIVRYTNHFTNPNMRFGLTGGAEDLLEDYVFNTSHYLGEKELEHEIFGSY